MKKEAIFIASFIMTYLSFFSCLFSNNMCVYDISYNKYFISCLQSMQFYSPNRLFLPKNDFSASNFCIKLPICMYFLFIQIFIIQKDDFYSESLNLLMKPKISIWTQPLLKCEKRYSWSIYSFLDVSILSLLL